MSQSTTVHEHREIYRGRILSLVVDRVTLPSGHTATMEVVRHPGSVVLLPMPAPGRLILIRQYRYALDRFIFGDWLRRSTHGVHLLGASIGAWRMATACLDAPAASLATSYDAGQATVSASSRPPPRWQRSATD